MLMPVPQRRMCLSVILLYSSQCSQSLQLAASDSISFQDLMSGVETKPELQSGTQAAAEVQVGDRGKKKKKFFDLMLIF